MEKLEGWREQPATLASQVGSSPRPNWIARVCSPSLIAAKTGILLSSPRPAGLGRGDDATKMADKHQACPTRVAMFRLQCQSVSIPALECCDHRRRSLEGGRPALLMLACGGRALFRNAAVGESSRAGGVASVALHSAQGWLEALDREAQVRKQIESQSDRARRQEGGLTATPPRRSRSSKSTSPLGCIFSPARAEAHLPRSGGACFAAPSLPLFPSPANPRPQAAKIALCPTKHLVLSSSAAGSALSLPLSPTPHPDHRRAWSWTSTLPTPSRPSPSKATGFTLNPAPPSTSIQVRRHSLTAPARRQLRR